MRFDGFNTLEGRHLVFAYGSVILIQAGYALYILRSWLKLSSAQKKQRNRSGDQLRCPRSIAADVGSH
jgi:hypothetical protein